MKELIFEDRSPLFEGKVIPDIKCSTSAAAAAAVPVSSTTSASSTQSPSRKDSNELSDFRKKLKSNLDEVKAEIEAEFSWKKKDELLLLRYFFTEI